LVVVPSPQLIEAEKSLGLSVPLLSVIVATCAPDDVGPMALPSCPATGVAVLTLHGVAARSDRSSSNSRRLGSRDREADRRRWRRSSRAGTPFGVRDTVKTLKALNWSVEGYSK
jgi:hypothetical protein